MVSMQGPVVTIVVPVYNAEDTILECLQSIKAQTWSALNVLLVDDGSTDHSYARIADCIATDSRFTLIPPPPQRQEGARRDAEHGYQTCCR